MLVCAAQMVSSVTVGNSCTQLKSDTATINKRQYIVSYSKVKCELLNFLMTAACLIPAFCLDFFQDRLKFYRERGK